MRFVPPLRTEYMKIFFDESGQDKDRPCTMAGLLIPDTIYNSPKLMELNEKLINKELKLHWTEYTGDIQMRNNIYSVIEVFTTLSQYTRMNVINYNTSTLHERYKLSEHEGSKSKKKRRNKKIIDYATLMVYTKIPERIFYGLLRHYGKDIYIKSEIFIEKEGKYVKYELEKRLLENLNTQSLYRAQQYWVDKCQMVEKQKMIGVELVDLLLGIIRLILKNEEIRLGLSDEEYKKQKLKGSAKKLELTIDLLKIPGFYDFLSNINYYEWDSDKQLSEVSFKDYLDLFMTSYYSCFNS